MTNLIRLARGDDGPAVAAIYAPYVRDTAVSFELEPPTAEQMAARIISTLQTHPWLVAEQGGNVIGYAYASTHRTRAAYQWSTDVSVYIDSIAQRTGAGRALYRELFGLLKRQGFWNAYAGITLPNEASVGLHESLGFRMVGAFHDVGFKLGRWHDVGWWELRLGETGAPSGPPVPLGSLDQGEKP